jgi:small subunit ribosomal protein S16
METKIRLARFGAKKRPFYRIVVASVTSPRDGRFLEVVGHYDPAKGVEKASINKEKVELWMKKGAKPSDLVRQILKRAPALSQ